MATGIVFPINHVLQDTKTMTMMRQANAGVKKIQHLHQRTPTPTPTPKPSDCTGAYHYDSKSQTCVLNNNCKEGTDSSTNPSKTVYCTVTDVKTKKVYVNKYPVYRQNIINYITVSNINHNKELLHGQCNPKAIGKNPRIPVTA